MGWRKQKNKAGKGRSRDRMLVAKYLFTIFVRSGVCSLRSHLYIPSNPPTRPEMLDSFISRLLSTSFIISLLCIIESIRSSPSYLAGPNHQALSNKNQDSDFNIEWPPSSPLWGNSLPLPLVPYKDPTVSCPSGPRYLAMYHSPLLSCSFVTLCFIWHLYLYIPFTVTVLLTLGLRSAPCRMFYPPSPQLEGKKGDVFV